MLHCERLVSNTVLIQAADKREHDLAGGAHGLSSYSEPDAESTSIHSSMPGLVTPPPELDDTAQHCYHEVLTTHLYMMMSHPLMSHAESNELRDNVSRMLLARLGSSSICVHFGPPWCSFTNNGNTVLADANRLRMEEVD